MCLGLVLECLQSFFSQNLCVIIFNITQDGSVHLPLCVILSVTQDSVHLPLSVIFRLIYKNVGISMLHSASYTTLWLCLSLFVMFDITQDSSVCIPLPFSNIQLQDGSVCISMSCYKMAFIQDGSVTVSLSSSISTSDVTGLDFFFT